MQTYKAYVVLSFPFITSCCFLSCFVCFSVSPVAIFISQLRSSYTLPPTFLAVTSTPHFTLQRWWSRPLLSPRTLTYVSAVQCICSDPMFVFSLLASCSVMSPSFHPSHFSRLSPRPFPRKMWPLAASLLKDTALFTFIISICRKCFPAIFVTYRLRVAIDWSESGSLFSRSSFIAIYISTI